jgi:hypothetical protein
LASKTSQFLTTSSDQCQLSKGRCNGSNLDGFTRLRCPPRGRHGMPFRSTSKRVLRPKYKCSSSLSWPSLWKSICYTCSSWNANWNGSSARRPIRSASSSQWWTYVRQWTRYWRPVDEQWQPAVGWTSSNFPAATKLSSDNSGQREKPTGTRE